ncbi:MAG: UDP-N-acetylglucosamine 2-epimerase (non-hydrolyzing) [Deinococcota bacterium]
MSTTKKHVCVAIGTRPEAVKMAPVIHALRHRDDLNVTLLTTGQHREQLDAMLQVFNLVPDVDLGLMQPGQGLAELFGRMVPAVAHQLRELRPDYLLVHGDTLTTFAVTLAAFFEDIPVAHVEAGLRTYNLREPFPEEASRRMCDAITDLDLPPTGWAKQNLLREGKPESTMVVTGNTVVDAVQQVLGRAKEASAKTLAHLPTTARITLTMHRRENLPVMRELAEAVATLSREFPAFHVVYPVHLNPVVQNAVRPVLESVPNVYLEQPYDYISMLGLMSSSELIITDSGGIQEEGTALGVPVVVLRNVTERPEGIEVGALKLAGNDPEKLLELVRPLLQKAIVRPTVNPYGDGQAGERVAQAVAWRLGLADKPADWLFEPVAATNG